MPIRIRCPNPECGQTYKAHQSQLGRRIVCQKCGQPFALTAPEEGTDRPKAESDTAKAGAPPAQGSALERQQLGRFQIRSRLGAGGFGSVYRAYDPVLDREVALKVPHRGRLESDQDKERFLREAKVAARLRHPNIVPVYEAGVDGDTYYIVSAFVEGRTLDDAIAEKRLDVGRAVELVRELAGALQYAHQLGVVHRDVKPANIMLDASGAPLVTDFGLARLAKSEESPSQQGLVLDNSGLGVADVGDRRPEMLTQYGAVFGTAAYMAPEQARGEQDEVGPASDQYSVGVVLYELLCGQTPFSGPPDLVISLVKHQEPPSPRTVDGRIPTDLEAICLKAMSKERLKRYWTCRELAEDLRRWQDGEPIHARQISPAERFWRWCRRNPVVAGLAAAVLLVLLLGIMISTHFGLAAAAQARVALDEKGRAEIEKTKAEQQQKRAEDALEQLVSSQQQRALAQVDALRRAEIGQVPYLIENLKASRAEVAPRFKQLLQQPDLTEKERLRISLAMLEEDPGQVEYLRDRLLTAEPAELLVIRAALVPHRDKLTKELWQVFEDPKSQQDRRFRAACSLAAYDADSSRWEGAGKPVAEALVAENALVLATWMEALRPVRRWLLLSLQAIFQDAQRPESERSLVTGILADYAADQAPILAGLIQQGDARQFAVLMPKLKAHGPAAADLLEKELAKDIPQHATAEDNEMLAKGRANAAVALLDLNRPARVWSLLKHSPDPGARSWLIHRLAPLGADPQTIIRRLEEEEDVSIRRALLLALGEFPVERLADEVRQPLVARLLTLYGEDPDAGIHGAAEWLLRQWGQEKQLQKVDGDSATGKVEGNRHWYVTGQGHTMVIIHGPVEFLMGSPASEADRDSDETQHRRRIGRSFALASKAVTVKQYQGFLKENPGIPRPEATSRYRPKESCPQGAVTWYEAAAYCNWLSKSEGIPEKQWCYLPNSSGQYAAGMKPAPDLVERAGYRLPTEAEWEYACRAGAVTSRYYGASEELLAKYAWYLKNSQDRSWPVGSLKPNELGLFDMLGNVWQWCHDAHANYEVPGGGGVIEDVADGAVAADKIGRVLRGGSFSYPPSYVRSAYRTWNLPVSRNNLNGLRVARTYH